MWPWSEVRKAIDGSRGNFPAFLRSLPRSEVERLICSMNHQRNVYGFFDGTNGDRAREIFDEIMRRAADVYLDPWY